MGISFGGVFHTGIIRDSDDFSVYRRAGDGQAVDIDVVNVIGDPVSDSNHVYMFLNEEDPTSNPITSSLDGQDYFICESIPDGV